MVDRFRQWVLGRPLENSNLTTDLFELRELPVPEIKEGQALVRIKLINIHSATRMRMASGATKVGETDRSNYACAEVVASRDRTFKVGDLIACQAGWQEYQVISSESAAIFYPPPSELVKALNGSNSQWNYVFRPPMAAMWPPEVLMDVFGTSGMTAYFGMRECGPLIPRDRVAVAGASGSVGSIVVQLAKIAGCYVVGFAGGAERCRWVIDTLGADRCLDYRAPDFTDQLKLAFPGGIDLFSDGIGGDLTATVVQQINRYGRIFSFGGAAAFYTDELETPAERPSMRRQFGLSPDVERTIALRNIRSEAWIVDHFYDERLKAEGDLSRLLRRGLLKPVTNVVEGFEALPEAIVALYAGSRSGKLQVRFVT